MANMTQAERSQYSRIDLQETRSRLTAVSERGRRVLAGLTVAFIGVLAVLTYAAVQVFDGWHHLIVVADFVVVFFAIAMWLYSMRPATEIESKTRFIPLGVQPTKKL